MQAEAQSPLSLSRQYSAEQAQALAVACSGTNRRDDLFVQHVLGMQSINRVESGGHFAHVGNAGPMTVVIFEGSLTIEDWLTDGQAKLRYIHEMPGRVHTGFARAMGNMLGELLANIPMEKPIQIAGHSLGGAMATIVAEYLSIDHDILPVYTYGSPAVGDAGFVAKFKPSHFRHVNGLDVVPHLPLQLWGYRHTGATIELGSHVGLKAAAGAALRVLKGDRAVLAEPFVDHEIARYIASIAATKTELAAAA